jgi:DNA-binding transcriptional regulator GbsR (MarR family)
MTPSEADFVERVGRHFEADGVPRIGGRLYGFLLLQDEPRSLDELAAGLSVSKASVSTNARLLVQWGIVDRVTRPGDRRDFYTAAPDLVPVLQRRLQRVREVSDLLAAGSRAVPPDRPAAAERLSTMAEFNARAADRLEEFLAGWREGHEE